MGHFVIVWYRLFTSTTKTLSKNGKSKKKKPQNQKEADKCFFVYKTNTNPVARE